MIRAKFWKAVPTDEGLTYYLKGPKDKASLHDAVDLQGEECLIAQLHEKDETEDEAPESLDAIVDRINALTAKIRARGWEKPVDMVGLANGLLAGVHKAGCDLINKAEEAIKEEGK